MQLSEALGCTDLTVCDLELFEVLFDGLHILPLMTSRRGAKFCRRGCAGTTVVYTSGVGGVAGVHGRRYNSY